jgi:hypothetical protein
LTCSALKRSYRDIIIGDRRDVVLVYLRGSPDLIHLRMTARREHFMPVALLDSQLRSRDGAGSIFWSPTPVCFSEGIAEASLDEWHRLSR